MWHMWDGGGWWGLMMVWMLLFWVALGVGLYFLIRALMRPGVAASGHPAVDTPRTILDRRLAAGEITHEEYDGLRRKIDGA